MGQCLEMARVPESDLRLLLSHDDVDHSISAEDEQKRKRNGGHLDEYASQCASEPIESDSALSLEQKEIMASNTLFPKHPVPIYSRPIGYAMLFRERHTALQPRRHRRRVPCKPAPTPTPTVRHASARLLRQVQRTTDPDELVLADVGVDLGRGGGWRGRVDPGCNGGRRLLREGESRSCGGACVCPRASGCRLCGGRTRQCTERFRRFYVLLVTTTGEELRAGAAGASVALALGHRLPPPKRAHTHLPRLPPPKRRRMYLP